VNLLCAIVTCGAPLSTPARVLVSAVLAGALTAANGSLAFGAPPSDDDSAHHARHVRYLTARIAEVADFAYTRSAAFRALVNSIEASDVIVYVEDGWCSHGIVPSCLRFQSANGGVRYLRVDLRSRRSVISVVAQLAHELHHANEIAGQPDVVDATTLRAFYAAIGFASCNRSVGECWETRGAADSERIVREEVRTRSSIAALRP